MTKPIKDYRFVCAEGCRPGRWTAYTKAIRDMKRHGPERKRGQGHGGSVMRRHLITEEFNDGPGFFGGDPE